MFSFLCDRISPVQLSDSGVYTCLARSRAGLAELSYDVQVQGTTIEYQIFPGDGVKCLDLKKGFIRCVFLVRSAPWCGSR